jgi:glycosyltransferase involved in cell wall biosynthesis
MGYVHHSQDIQHEPRTKMKLLIVATSRKPRSFEKELQEGRRYRLEYLELCNYFNATYVDYDPPGMHQSQGFRSLEERFHIDFYWARHITKLVKEQGYDMVISMSERIGVPLGLLLPPDIKHITLLLNAFSHRWLPFMRLSKVYQRWDKIITNSYVEAEALKSILHLAPEKITTIHNCVDLDFFNPSIAKFPKESNGVFMMSQGLAKRDYPTLIRALWKIPHVQCHISAVSAWDKHKAGYEGMKIPANVTLKAYDHPYEIRNAMAESQFLVIPLQPEIGMWCAGSTSVLQTQAMGKPIVVTNLRGTSEYVKDNETGLLVNGKDPDMLAEKIDFLWRNVDQAKIMGNNGRTWMNETFSMKTWINKMAGVIEETYAN